MEAGPAPDIWTYGQLHRSRTSYHPILHFGGPTYLYTRLWINTDPLLTQPQTHLLYAHDHIHSQPQHAKLPAGSDANRSRTASTNGFSTVGVCVYPRYWLFMAAGIRSPCAATYGDRGQSIPVHLEYNRA